MSAQGSQYLFSMLQKAGTTICNNLGYIYFDLNSKSEQDCQALKDVLHGVARLTGSQVYVDVPHPLTQSSATIQLALNIDSQNPQAETARQFRDLLFKTGNAYYYETGELTQTLGRFGHAFNDQKTVGMMKECKKMVSGFSDWELGRSLHEHVLLAVALNASSSENIFDETVHVPLNLYMLDSVKAQGVEALLRGGAAVTKGTYIKETVLDRNGEMTGFHAVKSPELVRYLATYKSNNQILMDDVFRAEVQADVVRSSLGPTHVAPAPLKRDTGDILRELGIQSVDTDQIAGIGLMGRQP